MGSLSEYLEGRIKIPLGALSTSKHGDCPAPFVSSAAASEFERLLSDPNGYISGFATFDNLEKIIKELGISREEFHRRRQLTDIPHVSGGHDIYCLVGQECLTRARELLGADFACTIRLYCVPLGSSATFSTGRVYLNIRKYFKENNIFLAQHWFDKLTGCEPVHVLAIMKHEEVQDAMDTVLPFIGLWDDFTLGNWAKHLATHCSWSIANFWTHIETVWSKIMNYHADKKHLVDGETFRLLEFCSPSNCEDDRRKIEQWMRDGEIFSNISSPATRKRLLRNILAIKGIIPSIRTFEENMRYFSIGAKILQKHLMTKEAMKKSRFSLVSNEKAVAPSLFAGLDHDWKGSRPLVEVSEGCFKPLVLSSPKDLKKILFIQLLLSALRQFPLCSTELPLRNIRSKPLNTMYSPTCVRWLCARAKALGYQNRKITEGLLLDGPSRTHQDVSKSVSPDWRGGKPTLATFCDLQTISFLPTIQSRQSQRATSLTLAFVLSDFLRAFFKEIHFGVDFAHPDIRMDVSIKDRNPSNTTSSAPKKSYDISLSTEVEWRKEQHRMFEEKLNKSRKRRRVSSGEEVEIRRGEKRRRKRRRLQPLSPLNKNRKRHLETSEDEVEIREQQSRATLKRRRLHLLRLNKEPQIDFVGRAQEPQFNGQLSSTLEEAGARNHRINSEDNTSMGPDFDQTLTMTLDMPHVTGGQSTEDDRSTGSLSPEIGHAETQPIRSPPFDSDHSIAGVAASPIQVSPSVSQGEPQVERQLIVLADKLEDHLSEEEVALSTTEAGSQHHVIDTNPVTSPGQRTETAGSLSPAISHAKSNTRRSSSPNVEMPLPSSPGSSRASEVLSDRLSPNRESVRSLPLIPSQSNSLTPDTMSSALRNNTHKRRREEVVRLKYPGNHNKKKSPNRSRRQDEVGVKNKRQRPFQVNEKRSSTLEYTEAHNREADSMMGVEDNTSMDMNRLPLTTTEVEPPPHFGVENIQRVSDTGDDAMLDTLTDHSLETGLISFTPVHQSVLEESRPQPYNESQRDKTAVSVSPLLDQSHNATSPSRSREVATTTGSLSPVLVHAGSNDPTRSPFRQNIAIQRTSSRRGSEEHSETDDQPQTQQIDRESVRSLPCIPLQFSGPAPNATSSAPEKSYDISLSEEVKWRKEQNRIFEAKLENRKRHRVSSGEEVEIRRGEKRRGKRRRLQPPQPLNENRKRYRETSEDEVEIREQRNRATLKRRRLHSLRLNKEPQVDFVGRAQEPQFNEQLDSTLEETETRNHGLNTGRDDQGDLSVHENQLLSTAEVVSPDTNDKNGRVSGPGKNDSIPGTGVPSKKRRYSHTSDKSERRRHPAKYRRPNSFEAAQGEARWAIWSSDDSHRSLPNIPNPLSG